MMHTRILMGGNEQDMDTLIALGKQMVESLDIIFVRDPPATDVAAQVRLLALFILHIPSTNVAMVGAHIAWHRKKGAIDVGWGWESCDLPMLFALGQSLCAGKSTPASYATFLVNAIGCRYDLHGRSVHPICVSIRDPNGGTTYNRYNRYNRFTREEPGEERHVIPNHVKFWTPEYSVMNVEVAHTNVEFWASDHSAAMRMAGHLVKSF